jgi:DNA repair exonuclease SbcCD nuclease subunit
LRIAIINDTHFGARQDHPAINEFIYKFWEGTFFPYLKENNIRHILHLGDFVDRRKFINYVTLSHLRRRFMDYIKDNNIHMFAIVGNHDIPYKNSNEVNAVNELFRDYQNVELYSSPKEIELDGLKIALLPWINSTNLGESMEFIKNTEAQVLCGHLELQGFEMDRGNICHEGLSADLFERFDTVMSGHFHHKSTKGNIHYLGNQYELTWADYGDQRGFHVLDTGTRDIEFVPNPNSIFFKIYYNDENLTFQEIVETDYSKFAQTYVKIVVQKKSNQFLLDTMIDQITKAAPLDLSVVEDFSDTISPEDVEVDEAEDTISILNKYIDSLTLPVDSVKMKSVLNQVYAEALELENS